jgi:small subunit ribosomal protein S20
MNSPLRPGLQSWYTPSVLTVRSPCRRARRVSDFQRGECFVPNIKSVIKDVKKSRKNHLRNISAKSAMKTFIKKAKATIATGEAEAIAAVVGQTVSIIDKTAERGIIHKNAAARRKSRLMKRAHKATTSA